VKILLGVLVVMLFAASILAACGGSDRVSGPAVVYVRQGRQWPNPIDTASFHYVRVLGSDGKTVVTRRLSYPTKDEPVSHVALQLDPGNYRLIFFERDCNGPAVLTPGGDVGCESLEQPSLRCEYALEVGEGETVALVARVVRPSNNCEIEGE
jgi:hypothetical protein